MAKDIPAEFSALDTAVNFIPGQDRIDCAADDPLTTHGSDTRWLWANFKAETVASLTWYDNETVSNTGVAAVFDADPDLKILIPKDDAFDKLKIRVDYLANTMFLEGIKVTIEGVDHLLPTVAAAGALRSVILTLDTNLDGKGYTGVYEALVYLKAATPSNVIQSISFIRVPPAGAIADGSQYGGAFVAPDDSELAPDKPLTPTKVYSVVQAIEALRTYRKRNVLVFARPLRGTTVDYNWSYVDNRGLVHNNTGLLGARVPLMFKGFDSDRAADCYYQLNAAQAINAHGGDTDNPAHTTRLVPVAPFVDTLFDGALTVKPETPENVQQWYELKIAPEINMSWVDCFAVVGV